MSWTYNLKVIKVIYGGNAREPMTRVGCLLPVILTIHWAYDTPLLVMWWVAYLATNAFFSLAVRALPDIVHPGAFSAVLMFEAANVIGYFALIYLLTKLLPVVVAVSLAVAALIGMVINSLTVRATDLLMFVSDVIVVVASAPILSLTVLKGDFSTAQAMVIFSATALMLIYYLLNLHANRRVHESLAEALVARQEQAKIAAMGRLTGGVAHDFNNLLTVIMGNIELARDHKDDKVRAELLDEAYQAGERASETTAQLLSFARQSVLRPERFDLIDMLTRHAELLRRVLPSSIRVVFLNRSAVVPFPLLDVGKFETMLLNLALNARDAMPEGGTLTISVIGQDDGVDVVVQDSGTGIAPDLLARVTDPFFTTKPAGRGTGLGLSMAKGFVEQSGGRLSIQSVEGEGATIIISLPLAPEVSA